MKFLYSKHISRLPEILRLRYNKESPSESDIPLFSITIVSKYLKLDFKVIESLIKFYKRNLNNSMKNSNRIKLTL